MRRVLFVKVSQLQRRMIPLRQTVMIVREASTLSKLSIAARGIWTRKSY
jgi:hypothetical protein